MFATHVGDETLSSELENGGSRLFYSVTRDTKNKRIFLKLVNASPQPQAIDLKFTGAALVKSGKLWTLSARSTQATNTIDTPENIVPKESALRNISSGQSYTAPAYSIQVLELTEQ
jgi:alpha-N-arabinofuranosidase